MPNSTSFQPVSAPPDSRLYRLIWRWHFYAGLFCLPFVLLLALSGAVYLFKPQIDALVELPFQNLEASAPRASPNAQIEAALAAVPDSTFLNYRVPETQQQAVVISLANAQGERILVYLDPFSLEVLKIIAYDAQFIRQVRSLHGELLAGTTGSLLVELAGNWAIVLLLSGLYLWWPRQRRGLAGLLWPRLRAGGRTFWRDLHAVTGFWVAGFALLLLITGLPWTLVWNSAFTTLREGLQGPQPVQEWTLSRGQEHAMHLAQGVAAVDLAPAVLARAGALGLAAPAELSVDAERPQLWKLASDHGNRRLRDQYWLDAHSGEVVEARPFAAQAPLDRAIGLGIALHEGQLFGWLNQALGLFTALALLGMSVSGFVLWRRRRPSGLLGAPRPLPDARAGRALSLLLFGLALLLPLLALSLVALALLEWLLLRHLPPLRRWLGLTAPAAGC